MPYLMSVVVFFSPLVCSKQQNQQLSNQLQSAKEALKAPSPADAGLVAEVEKMKERVAEAETLLHRKDHELEQYTVSEAWGCGFYLNGCGLR